MAESGKTRPQAKQRNNDSRVKDARIGVAGLHPKPAKSLPAERSPHLEKTLEMARVLIADVGIEGLNMRDLAAVTGSSLRTLYGHFGSKDQLLAIVVADTFEGLIDPVRNSQPTVPSGVQNIVQLMQSLNEIALARTAYVKIILGIYHKHDNNRDAPNILYSMMFDRMSVCIDQLIGKRAIPKKEVDLLKEEATDRIFSVVMKWTLKTMPGNHLVHRLIYSTLSCLAAYATPAQSKEIDRAIAEALNHLSKT